MKSIDVNVYLHTTYLHISFSHSLLKAPFVSKQNQDFFLITLFHNLTFHFLFEINKYPWIVALMDWLMVDGHGYPASSFCGGTLVASKYVITAAHCIDGKSTSDFKAGLNFFLKCKNSFLCAGQDWRS